ncbi:MAG: META domain-containing protein [Rikenellaceae bacterium]|nr:META domain-containing protein [Rikenellaceae bacterium]
MKKLFAVLLVAVLSVGCCSSCRWRYKNAKPLEGTVWHLVKMGGESVTLPADSFNIILNENALGGRGACNSLLGQYATGEKFALRFSALGSTKMLCPENEALEMALIGVLDKTTHYDIDYDMLMLMHEGEIMAVFKAQQK